MYAGGDEDENNMIAMLHEEDEEIIANTMTSHGKDSKVHLRHRSGPWKRGKKWRSAKSKLRRKVGVRAQHENKARTRLHTAHFQKCKVVRVQSEVSGVKCESAKR